jgi:hypothetical protein
MLKERLSSRLDALDRTLPFTASLLGKAILAFDYRDVRGDLLERTGHVKRAELAVAQDPGLRAPCRSCSAAIMPYPFRCFQHDG